MNNKKLWYPAAMVIALSVAAGAAQAKSLEQVGAADSQAEPLKTYGVDVAAKSGLKTLLPSGWNLFIYKNTNLPQSISWSVGDTWMTALEKFADKNSLAVRLDWAKKAVYVSSPEVAIESRAKLAEIDNAARTPLPTYAPATKPTASSVTATLSRPVPATAPLSKPSGVSPATVAPAGESRMSSDLLARALAATAPKTAVAMAVGATGAIASVGAQGFAAPVAAVANAGTAFVGATTPAGPRPVVAGSLPPLPFSMPATAHTPVAVAAPAPVPASDAFVRGNLEDIVRATASKLGYQVSWETVSLPLNGPVTFLGMDAAEDMRLLQKSLGLRQSPIAIEVYRGSSVIRVSARGPGREPLAIYDTTYSGLVGFGPRPAAPAPMLAVVAASPVQVANGGQSTWIDTAATTAYVPPVAAVIPVVTKQPAFAAEAPLRNLLPEMKVPAPVAPMTMTLKISKGDSLSKAIAGFLKEQGWELKWMVPNDMEADFPFTATGTSVAKVLGQLLPNLGLDTDMYAPSKMVVVRPIDNTAE